MTTLTYTDFGYSGHSDIVATLARTESFPNVSSLKDWSLITGRGEGAKCLPHLQEGCEKFQPTIFQFYSPPLAIINDQSLNKPVIVSIHFGYSGHLTGIIILKHGSVALNGIPANTQR